MSEENDKHEKLSRGTKIYRSYLGGVVTVMAAGSLGTTINNMSHVTSKEFEAYKTSHQQWAEEVMKGNEHRFNESKDAWLRIESKLDRFLNRGAAAGE